MKTLKAVPAIFFGAAALAFCLPGASFGGGLNEAPEYAHAEAAWLDGAQKPKGREAVLAGAAANSGGALSLGKAAPTSRKMNEPRSPDDIADQRENHFLDWTGSLFSKKGFWGSLGNSIKSLASPLVLGYDTMVSNGMKAYSTFSLPGLAVGGVVGAVLGVIVGAGLGIGGFFYGLYNAIVRGPVKTAGSALYNAADSGFQKLFNITR